MKNADSSIIKLKKKNSLKKKIIEHLLSAKHCSEHWEYISEQKDKISTFIYLIFQRKKTDKLRYK